MPNHFDRRHDVEGSDGLQNLTESLLAVQLVRVGIYVAFLGAIYPVLRVRKDRALGRFVYADGPEQH